MLSSRLSYPLFGLVLCALAFTGIARSEESIEELRVEVFKLANDVMNPKSLSKAIEICEKILEMKEDDFEALALHSRLCWSLGNHEEQVRDQKKWFKKGQEMGKRVKDLYPDKADGYYWYAVNYGELIDRSSIFAKIGAKKVIVENMDKVLALNEKFDSGGAYIILGRINYIAPGGSYSKAIQYYEKAMEIGPKRTTAYLYLGELYLHEHVFDKAEKLLRKVMEMEIDSRYAIEAKGDRIAAKKLLNKLDRKDDRFPEQEDLTGR